jgi:hypothetical protein
LELASEPSLDVFLDGRPQVPMRILSSRRILMDSPTACG